MDLISHASKGDLSVYAHLLKSVFGIKFTRATQRHASAMGFASPNHLLEALKVHPVEREYEQYIAVLKNEMFAHHQISLTEDTIAALHDAFIKQQGLKL
jgi:hypothetical protein